MKIRKIYIDDCPFNPCGQGGIQFEDDSLIVDLHDQDCCEHVYADFSNLDTDIMNYDFKSVSIRDAKEGFMFGDGRRWFFVPCYNEQNGYYNDALDIAYGHYALKLTGYNKKGPTYKYQFVPKFTLEGCQVEDQYY